MRKRIIFSTVIGLCSQFLSAQDITRLLRYTDFHIHPTYKHYFRYSTAMEVKELYTSFRYDRATDSILTPDSIRKKYATANWVKYLIESKKQITDIQFANVSDLRNYDQASYNEIAYVPGSILCNSYSPYEKQFALKPFQRWASSKIVTRMGRPRLDAFAENDHSPFRDFLAEYHFNIVQDDTRLIEMQPLTVLYLKDKVLNDKASTECYRYFNKIQMVTNAGNLAEIIRHNDRVIASNFYCGRDSIPTIITPLLMCIEGGQVLYDTISANSDVIRDPQFLGSIFRGADGNFKTSGKTEYDKMKAEMLSRIDSMRSMKHRLFFMNPAHFAENHFAGFAKTLDREPDHLNHRLLSTLTSFAGIRRNILKKDYEGINVVFNNIHSRKPVVYDSLGYHFIEAFLRPDPKFNKPTYIDVKHMDVLGRIQYYAIRKHYKKKFGLTDLPIIASHMAVSGESQALAAATGLYIKKPKRIRRISDRYEEINDPLKVYKRYKKRLAKGKWLNRILEYSGSAVKDTAKKYENLKLIYRQTVDDSSFRNFTQLPPKQKTAVLKKAIDLHIDPSKADWYYPWSINLYDEEIIEIYQSNGIIGLMMDPRQLGAYMKKYKNIEKKGSLDSRGKRFRLGDDFDKMLADEAATLSNYNLLGGRINKIEYFKTEPLLRNIFYIVHLLKQYNYADKKFHGTNNIDTAKKICTVFYHDQDNNCSRYDPWSLLSIGADYDGLIDPMDVAPTASHIPYLRNRLVVYAYIYAKLHQQEFNDPETREPLIQSLGESSRLMEKIFYSNGRNFITKYF